MTLTNLLKLDRVQNEATRVILGTTKDTPTETVRFMLELSPLQTRQKVEQVKAYFSAVENPHEAVKDTKECGLLMYCPGHAGAKGNGRADRLAGKATLTSGLLLGRSEVLRSLRHYLRAQSQGRHTIYRLEERGVERGCTRRSSLEGRERAIVSQTNRMEPFQRKRWGKLLRDRVERL